MTPRKLAETAATLAAAVAGGALFHWLGVPVAWLSGPMVVMAVLAMYELPLRMPAQFRDFGFMTAGLSLGSTVTEEALASIQRYPWSLVGLVLSVIVTVAASKTILERVFGWDRATAFLASVPGALSMVMAVAVESDADVKRVAVVQAVRLLALVTILPMAITATNVTIPLAEHPVVAPAGLALLYAAALCASWVIRMMRLSNPVFLGGLLAGISLHVQGLVPGEVPPPLALGAMVLVGMFAGLRFAGTRARDVVAIVFPAVVVLVVALVLAALSAFPVHWATGLRLAEVMVAFAPGGFEAMVLMGAALGLDTLYISTHHVARAVGLNIVAPWFAPHRPPDDQSANPPSAR